MNQFHHLWGRPNDLQSFCSDFAIAVATTSYGCFRMLQQQFYNTADHSKHGKIFEYSSKQCNI